MRPSFLTLPKPHLSVIIQEPTPDTTIAAIRNAEHDGAQSFMIALMRMQEKDRSPEELRRIFHCTGRPMMPLAYRSGAMTADVFTDDMRTEVMFQALEAGAAGCDVMGDLFDPSPRELTRNPEAIRKQEDLIERIHSKGGTVLMSSHMSEPLKAEEVLEHLQQQDKRGADILKIVVTCDTDDEFVESIRTTLLLKKELKKPFIHLCNGKYARLQRYVCPMLGAALTFSLPAYTPSNPLATQPTTRAARAVLDELMWHVDYPE